ncbi:hypothetical protein [Flavobacterium sp.]|uniref:hypothetical protein n=1 Tax=Flavobacterium sp. TaxID=239 RepID=UPI00286D0AA8|nr:hypothetical protein [Flavobacterium sp.]
MKKINLFFTVSLLLFQVVVSAQNNGMRGNNQFDTEPTINEERQKEDIEKMNKETVEKSVAVLKTDLKLDALQEIAIKQIVTETFKTRGIIMKKEENQEKKLSALQALSETTKTKILALLNNDQKTKFLEKKDDAKKKKKKN